LLIAITHLWTVVKRRTKARVERERMKMSMRRARRKRT